MEKYDIVIKTGTKKKFTTIEKNENRKEFYKSILDKLDIQTDKTELFHFKQNPLKNDWEEGNTHQSSIQSSSFERNSKNFDEFDEKNGTEVEVKLNLKNLKKIEKIRSLIKKSQLIKLKSLLEGETIKKCIKKCKYCKKIITGIIYQCAICNKFRNFFYICEECKNIKIKDQDKKTKETSKHEHGYFIKINDYSKFEEEIIGEFNKNKENLLNNKKPDKISIAKNTDDSCIFPISLSSQNHDSNFDLELKILEQDDQDKKIKKTVEKINEFETEGKYFIKLEKKNLNPGIYTEKFLINYSLGDIESFYNEKFDVELNIKDKNNRNNN